MLNVELADQPLLPPDAPPPAIDPLQPPPLQQPLTSPAAPPVTAVAAPSPAIAFALPVEDPFASWRPSRRLSRAPHFHEHVCTRCRNDAPSNR